VEGKYRLEYPIGKVLYETGAWLSSLRISRDGQRVGFFDHPAPGDNRGRVAVVDLSGNLKVLTEDFSAAGGLAWSPGGEEIWFTAGKTGNVRAVYAVDLAGNQRIVDGAPTDMGLNDVSAKGRVLLTRTTSRRGMIGLAPGEATERDLSWLDWSRPADLSDDGQWLLFDEQGQGGGAAYSVYLRKTDGSPAVRLGDGLSSALSPDGKWVATTTIGQRDRIVFLPRGPGEARTLTVAGFDINLVTWFPDGKQLFLVGSEKGHLRRLYLMDESGGTPKPLSPEGIQFGAAVSQDGRFVAAIVNDIMMIFPVDGSEPRPVPGAQPGDIVLRFGEGGRTLFVAQRSGPGSRIDSLEIGSGRRTTWKELMPADQAGLIDSAYYRLSSDGRSYVYSYRRVLATLYLVEGLM
jgi:Tol biopolymer transport system component